MKKIISMLAFCALTLSVSAQSEVTVYPEGLPDGTIVEASLGSTHRAEKPLMSATVEGGKYVMTLPLEDARYISFGVKGANGYFLNLMTGKGEKPVVHVKVSSSVNDGQTWYEGKSMTVKGSPLQAEYDLKIGEWHDALNRMYDDYHAAFDSINPKDTFFVALEKKFFTNVKNCYKRIAADNKDTWWGPFSMLCLYKYFTPNDKPQWGQFSEAAKESFYGKLLDEQINPKGLTGQSYPIFNILDANGKTKKSTAVTKGKKYLLIDFWASWCVPCRKEIPNLKAVYAQYQSKGLQIVSISIDRSDAAWKKALAVEKLPWPNGIDKSGIADSYKVQAIPAMFLVDVSIGKIIAENLQGESLRNKLVELMP